MGWESSGVVGFDLGPLLQGQTRTAKLKRVYNSFIYLFIFFFFFFFFFTFNILFIHPFFTSVQKNLGGREWQTLHQFYLQVQCIAKTTRSTFLLFYILLNRKITTDFFAIA